LHDYFAFTPRRHSRSDRQGSLAPMLTNAKMAVETRKGLGPSE
jgi:hypothetical protein